MPAARMGANMVDYGDKLYIYTTYSHIVIVTRTGSTATYLTVCAFVYIPEFNFNRFLPQTPQLQNQGNLGTQAAVVGSALPLGFIAFNVLRGDTDLSVSPNVALNVDPNTGRLAPAVSANVQVGNDNPVNPTINIGGQLDTNSNGPLGLPIAPVVGTGINIGDASSGQPTGNVGSNFALSNGQANAQFGGGLGLGAFNLGNPFAGFGR